MMKHTMKHAVIIVTAMTVLTLGATALDARHAVRADSAAQQTAIGEQTATFLIDNMTCALCPITVKTAMAGVAGVKSVKIDFEAKTATVVFDPSVASVVKIAASSTNAGYPAKPVS